MSPEPQSPDPDATQRETSQPRPLLARAVTTYGTQIAVAALSLLTVLIVARALGPEGRGEVVFLMAMAQLSSQVSLLGVPRANSTFAPRQPERTPSLAANSVLLSALLGLLAIVIVATLVALVPAAGGGTDATLRWVALGSIPMLILIACLQQLAIAHYGFEVANLAWLAQPVATIALIGPLALAGELSIATAFGAWVVAHGLRAGMLVWHVARRLGGFGRPDAPLARGMLRFGVKAHGGQVMLVGNYRLDQWILGSVAGPRELGLYSVAVAWSESLFLLPTALQLVQRPDLVRATGRGAGQRAAWVFRAAVPLTVVLAGALILLAPFLCVTIFGSEFRGSVELLQVLTLGAFGITALKLLGSALTDQRKPMLETSAIAVSFVVMVVLDALLIPPHGALGAAIASTIAYSTGGIAAAIVFVRALSGHAGELVPRGGDVVAIGRRLGGLAGTLRATGKAEAPTASKRRRRRSS